jgi:hypothetical protein
MMLDRAARWPPQPLHDQVRRPAARYPRASLGTVTKAATAGTGRVARWMLLACTLFGLAAMHTLGHAGMQMGAHPEVMPGSTFALVGAHSASVDVVHAVVAGMTDGCADDDCTDPRITAVRCRVGVSA